MTTTKEIAAEIRNTFKQLKGVNLSVTCDYMKINVSLMEANFKATTNDKNYIQLGHSYYNQSDERITRETKTVFALVDEIISKYHYNRSDAMIDYFDTNFYYQYNVGRWDRDFKQVNN